MRILGHTPNQQPVALELSAREIVKSGIDPWRVDLMDTNPIIFEHGQQKILFSRLQGITFAFLSGGRYQLGFFDGENAICLSSEKASSLNWDHSSPSCLFDFTLSGLESEVVSFCTLFEEYLERLESLFKSKALGSNKVFPPGNATDLVLEGNTARMRLVDPMSACPITFFGEMFSERILPMPFPQQLNWPLEFFAAGKPVLAGSALRNLLRGKPVDRVEVLLQADYNTLARLIEEWDRIRPKKQIPRLGKSRLLDLAWEFEDSQCIYTVGLLDKNISGTLRSGDRYSVDGLYSSKKNEIRGTSIAFADVARSQTRAIGRSTVIRHHASAIQRQVWKLPEQSMLPIAARLLQLSMKEGLDFVDFPERTGLDQPRLGRLQTLTANAVNRIRKL